MYRRWRLGSLVYCIHTTAEEILWISYLPTSSSQAHSGKSKCSKKRMHTFVRSVPRVQNPATSNHPNLPTYTPQSRPVAQTVHNSRAKYVGPQQHLQPAEKHASTNDGLSPPPPPAPAPAPRRPFGFYVVNTIAVTDGAPRTTHQIASGVSSPCSSLPPSPISIIAPHEHIPRFESSGLCGPWGHPLAKTRRGRRPRVCICGCLPSTRRR